MMMVHYFVEGENMREKYVPQQIEKNGRKSGRIPKHLRPIRIPLRKNIMCWRCSHTPPAIFIWDM